MTKRVILAWAALALMATGAAAQTVTGSGTTNTVPVFTGTSTVGNSPISVSGGNVGIGTTNPSALLHVVPTDASSYDYSTGIRVSRAGSDPVDQYVGLNFAQGAANLVSAGYQDYGYFQFLQYNGTTYRAAIGINNLGNVGIGTTSPAYTLDVAGQIHSSTGGYVFPDGSTQTTAFIPANCGADYAEAVDVTGDRTKYEPGDLLVIDPDNPGKFLKSNQAYSTLVAGIYSTKPGFVGRLEPAGSEASKTEVPMAMVGRVPTKVSAENGPIKVGDLLVTSSTMGYAMKGTDRSRMMGAVVGKALGSLDSGTGVIEVLVTLQ